MIPKNSPKNSHYYGLRILLYMNKLSYVNITDFVFSSSVFIILTD